MKQIKIIDSVFLTSAQSIQDSPPPNKAEIVRTIHHKIFL